MASDKEALKNLSVDEIPEAAPDMRWNYIDAQE